MLTDGAWKCTLEVRRRCLAIFRTGAIMDGIAAPAVLDAYAAKFRERVGRHPPFSHLVAQADVRRRSEFWGAERR
eukprot:14155980-Alexandrium_andersonii.AAC.1